MKPRSSKARHSASRPGKLSAKLQKLKNLSKFEVITSILVLLICLLQVQLWFGSANFLNLWRLHEAIIDRQKINQDWETRNNHLYAAVNNLKTGANVVEAQARMNLGMIKTGELYYQVVS